MRHMLLRQEVHINSKGIVFYDNLAVEKSYMHSYHVVTIHFCMSCKTVRHLFMSPNIWWNWIP